MSKINKEVKFNILSTVEMGKQDEIDILNQLHDGFKGTGNYLESLFSARFVEWAHLG